MYWCSHKLNEKFLYKFMGVVHYVYRGPYRFAMQYIDYYRYGSCLDSFYFIAFIFRYESRCYSGNY